MAVHTYTCLDVYVQRKTENTFASRGVMTFAYYGRTEKYIDTRLDCVRRAREVG